MTGIERAGRHLFLCLGPDCAPMEEGQATWDFLKRRCAELKLPVMRTKAGCLRVCVGGPVLLIYPEGVWYGGITPERCERILQEHVVQGPADRGMGAADASALRPRAGVAGAGNSVPPFSSGL